MIKRFMKKEEGFTLIELLIVIIIIGILMAIGIPAYLTYQAKAKDTQAKNNLNLAWKAARAGGVDNGGYYKTTVSIVGATGDIQADQPQLAAVRVTTLSNVFTNHCRGAAATVKSVYVVATGSDKTTIRFFVRSDSKKLFGLSGSAPYSLNNFNTPAYTAVTASGYTSC